MALLRITSLSALLFLSIMSILFSLMKGSTLISFNEFFNSQTLSHEIFFNIRLPRTINAFVTGSLLALAGALMQALLRNPLADPYVLGTSGGAAVATLLMMVCGVTGISLTVGAWAGSLLSISVIFILAGQKRGWNPDHLILIGIALASGFSAIISLILLTSTDHELRGMMFWLIGDLSTTHIPLFEIILLGIGLLFSLTLSQELNILIRGEKEALALGINVQNLKIKLFLLSSILTASAVTLAGCIGFIGLIVPHLFRLIAGYDHRFLLPCSALLGGSLLTFADTISRVAFAPQQLPVGIIMTIIGIPIFLFLLQRN